MLYLLFSALATTGVSSRPGQRRRGLFLEWGGGRGRGVLIMNPYHLSHSGNLGNVAGEHLPKL